MFLYSLKRVERIYPKKVCITQWGDNIDQQAVQIGMDITVSVDIQSREYNGNWYTDIKAWRVEQGTGEQNAPEIPPPPPALCIKMDSSLVKPPMVTIKTHAVR